MKIDTEFCIRMNIFVSVKIVRALARKRKDKGSLCEIVAHQNEDEKVLIPASNFASIGNLHAYAKRISIQ